MRCAARDGADGEPLGAGRAERDGEALGALLRGGERGGAGGRREAVRLLSAGGGVVVGRGRWHTACTRAIGLAGQGGRVAAA